MLHFHKLKGVQPTKKKNMTLNRNHYSLIIAKVILIKAVFFAKGLIDHYGLDSFLEICKYHQSLFAFRDYCLPELALGRPRITDSFCVCVYLDRTKTLHLFINLV